MSCTSVAVVGLGSRGLGVLERLVTLATLAGPEAGDVRVEVIDPLCDGAGVHAVDQPDYLLLNTTAAAVSMFPDEHTVGADAAATGPTLWEWATARGLRLAADGFTVGTAAELDAAARAGTTSTGSHGAGTAGPGARPAHREIRATDFLPRRVLGEYLGWVLGEVLRRAPAHVRVTLHRSAAVSLTGESPLVVGLADGSSVSVGHVFLTTGYTANVAPRAAVAGRVAQPYPLPGCVSGIAPGETVAIGGFGLSAMDVMSALTVGRGGRFEPVSREPGVPAGAGPAGDLASWELRYVPSGLEPELLFFSRSGAPCRARPRTVEFLPRHVPLHFTETAVDELRRRGPLDFDLDVLPLVLAEMRVAHDAACERLGVAPDPDFDPAALFDGTRDLVVDSSAGYAAWLAAHVRADLDEGVRGFTGSPVKAALDVLRDQRDMFRRVVDFGGLTDASLDEFTRTTVPAVNRAVVGPQFERHAELLALLDAGVAAVPFGPSPVVSTDGTRWTVSSTRLVEPCARDVDWVVAANLDLPSVVSSASPLVASLARAGRLRPHRPASLLVGGVDLDRDQHPIDATGRVDTAITVLGPLCEGTTFYNNLVPSPGAWSRPAFDAHRCVEALYARRRALVPTPGA